VKLKVGGEVRKSWRSAWTSPARWTLRAQTQLAEAGLPLNMEMKQAALLAVHRRKAVQADDLKLKLSGKMTDYTLAFRTAVKGSRCRRRTSPWTPRATSSRSISTS
jgi:translocation and assembly module TamB